MQLKNHRHYTAVLPDFLLSSMQLDIKWVISGG